MTSEVLGQENLTTSIPIDGQRFYDIVDKLCALADKKLQRSDYYDRCFQALCHYLNASAGLINVRLGPRTLERKFVSQEAGSTRWIGEADSLVLRAQTDETALATVYKSREGATVAYAIAAPVLSAAGRPFGAIGLIIRNEDFDNSQADLIQLSQLLELIVDNAPKTVSRQKNSEDPTSKTLQSVVRASDYRSIHHLCFAIANSLCGKLECEQIAIGLVQRRDIKLVAVSGLSEIPKSTPGMTAVRQSMAACYDKNEVTVVQESGRSVDQLDAGNCKIHHLWHRVTGGSCVATIPLRVDNECVAVVSLRRPATQPFSSDDLKRAQVLAESFAPALPLVDRASRSVARHLLESAWELCRRCYGWHGLGKKFIVLLVASAALWMALGKMDYQVLAPCKIVPEQVSTIAAPYDGMISNVLVLPGQSVKQGQLLAQIDTRDLKIERNRILSEIASTKIEANALLQERRAEEAFQLQAQIHVLTTDLELVNQKISRAEIRAQTDGVVLPTEIHRRVGQYVSLGESLLEIADENQWHLEIETPEGEARHLLIGQSGRFQTNARPDQRLQCEINKVSPSSTVSRQKNVVIAEAVLKSREDWMKIGMEGHVRIDTGKQPVWWIFLHPAIDYARMKLWL